MQNGDSSGEKSLPGEREGEHTAYYADQAEVFREEKILGEYTGITIMQARRRFLRRENILGENTVDVIMQDKRRFLRRENTLGEIT